MNVFLYICLQIIQYSRNHTVFNHHLVVMKSLKGPFLGFPTLCPVPLEAAHQKRTRQQATRGRVEEGIAWGPASLLATQEMSSRYFPGGGLGLGTTKCFLEYLCILGTRGRDISPLTNFPGPFHDDQRALRTRHT